MFVGLQRLKDGEGGCSSELSDLAFECCLTDQGGEGPAALPDLSQGQGEHIGGEDVGGLVQPVLQTRLVQLLQVSSLVMTMENQLEQ